METLKVQDQAVVIPAKVRPDDQFEITQMPDRETLEDFLRGSSSHPSVIFDLEKGIFVRTRPHSQIDLTIESSPQSV